MVGRTAVPSWPAPDKWKKASPRLVSSWFHSINSSGYQHIAIERAAVYDPSLATLHEKRGSLPPYWQLTIPPELTLYAMILAEMAIFTHYEITCFNNPNWKCRGLFWKRLCPIRGIYWLAISTFKRRFLTENKISIHKGLIANILPTH